MSTFFIKKTSISPIPDSFDERPFWEVQRDEVTEILVNLFSHWDNSWTSTKAALGNLNLSSSTIGRINFYEAEQKKALITILSRILVSWEKSDEAAFSNNILALAKEMRPSLPYVEYDPEEKLDLTAHQLSLLRDFITSESTLLKDSVRELQLLSWKKINFEENIITENAAEELIREKLGLTYFDFVDNEETPSFSDGYYPALLQDSTDQGF